MLARYSQIKAQFPHQGRRKWTTRLVAESWTTQLSFESDPYIVADELDIQDDDPFDDLLDDVVGGILVRTDYSDQDAWQAFTAALKRAEDEMIQESDSESEQLLKILNPTDAQQQAVLTDISNLTALRLFNDVGFRVAPQLPPGRKQRLNHPLIDVQGWQEVYSGVDIWIYDTKSNKDHSVRAVSHQGDIYGTATFVAVVFFFFLLFILHLPAETAGAVRSPTSTISNST